MLQYLNFIDICLFFTYNINRGKVEVVLMNKQERPVLPKGFFTTPRPTVSKKEALKDVVPFKWSKEVLEGKKEAILCKKRVVHCSRYLN